MNIVFQEYNPPPALMPYVEFFWEGKFNLAADNLLIQRVVPNGYIELIIHLTDLHCELLQGQGFGPSPIYTLIGLFTKPYDVHFRGFVNVFGIRFKPEGFHPVFRVPAAEIQEEFADVADLTGRKFREFCASLREQTTGTSRIAITEKFLLENLHRNKVNLNYLNRAVELIRHHKGLITVDELAGKVFISTRQLEREFKQKLGISPKQYLRIARLNEVNRLLENGEELDLTGISYESGFADQAHFIRDFKNFTGTSPKVFVKNRGEFIVNAGQAVGP